VDVTVLPRLWVTHATCPGSEQSPECIAYKNSGRFYPHIVVTLETSLDSMTNQAANPGQAEAFKAYLLRKYGIKATEVTPTLLPLTE